MAMHHAIQEREKENECEIKRLQILTVYGSNCVRRGDNGSLHFAAYSNEELPEGTAEKCNKMKGDLLGRMVACLMSP